MSWVKRNLDHLADRIFRHERKLLTAGFPVVLGQGLDEPCIHPRMVFYWHPPLLASSVEEREGKPKSKNRIRALLERVTNRRSR